MVHRSVLCGVIPLFVHTSRSDKPCDPDPGLPRVISCEHGKWRSASNTVENNEVNYLLVLSPCRYAKGRIFARDMRSHR